MRCSGSTDSRDEFGIFHAGFRINVSRDVVISEDRARHYGTGTASGYYTGRPAGAAIGRAGGWKLGRRFVRSAGPRFEQFAQVLR